MASPPQPRLSVHSHGLSLAAIAWRPRLGGEGSIANGPPRPQLDSCLASTATARRLRYHADGLTATPLRSQLGGHGLAASGWRAWLHGHDSTATARLPRLDGTVLLLRLHGSTTPRLGCSPPRPRSTATAHQDQLTATATPPRPRLDGRGLATTTRQPHLDGNSSTTTARRPHLDGHASPATA